jgi:phospholipase C
MNRSFWQLAFLVFTALHAERVAPVQVSFSADQIAQSKKIQHLIIIFQENWSFDSIYGTFPNVDGLANAKPENTTQIDLEGKAYPSLLKCVNADTGVVYTEIPKNLPNAPFDLSKYMPMKLKTGDLIHQFYQEQLQINGGRMNRFAAWSDAGGFVMSYFDISKTRMGALSRQFTLCDQWFHSCYGGSMCGVLWLFSAQMPVYPKAPKKLVSTVLPSGIMAQDGLVSPDGFAINDMQPFFWPYVVNTPEELRMAPQTYKTIGDLLSEKKVSWKWYAEGWDRAVRNDPDPTFAFHHQAPVYFQQFGPDTDARKEHLFDLAQFYVDLKQGQLPAVSFIRSTDLNSQHPGIGGLLKGLDWCADLIETIQKSSSWADCAIIVTYDENGGRWDHVTPPVVDAFGPATRVPATIISPFAKKNFVDHTQYETVSILKFIEERWELPSLSTRDAKANNILNAFDFN